MIRAAVVATCVVLAACGSDGSPAEDALKATEDNLSDIRSGSLDMTLLASSAEGREGRGVGFEMTGRFAVAGRKGSLPVADLEYTRITGDERRSTRFMSTGTAAFVEIADQAYRLTDEQVADLRRRDTDEGNGGLDGLRLEEWIEDPRIAGASRGADRITGTLDPIDALNDILELALALGAEDEELPRRLEGEAADRVRRAVRSTSATLVTGREDRVLRAVDVTIELSASDQERLRDALGRLAGVRLRFDLAVANPNRPVRVAAPADAQPISELDR